MIFSLKQEKRIDNILQNLKDDTSKNIEWVLKEEDYKYSNTIDESLTICLGHGELDHLQNNNTDNETYYYYSDKKQLDYFINIFRHGLDKIKVVVYECNNGQLNGSHKAEEEIIEF